MRGLVLEVQLDEDRVGEAGGREGVEWQDKGRGRGGGVELLMELL